MAKRLILAWRDPSTRSWLPVGMLEYRDNKYYFNYTQGADCDNFIAFGQMKDMTKVYVSDILFPIFQNRLLSKSRPEYDKYLEWLDIDKGSNNSILELSRSRGIRATDELQLFPIPEKNDEGNYEVSFFSHGISHMSEHYTKRLSYLRHGEELLILKDVQNEYDPHALILRSKEDPVELLGYCPAFFVEDFNKLLDKNGPLNVKVTVQKVNLDAPMQLRLLCKLTTKWPEEFQPFDHKNFLQFAKSEE